MPSNPETANSAGRKVLVCGGRTYDNWHLLNVTLSAIHAESPIGEMIHGDGSGADALADRWAAVNHISISAFPADWSKGRAAGPIRNQRMLDEAAPELVVAFSGGRGTADMVRRAKSAGVEVREISDER